jgi:hypothetical protein
MMVGGLEHTPLKYEKGARFNVPFIEQVETKAMGLGRMEPIIILWFSEKCWFLGSIIILTKIEDMLHH